MRMSWWTWWDFFCSHKHTLHRKYKDLYARGSDRIENDFNLVDILKRLRHLDVIMENSLLKNKDRVVKV